MPLGFTHLAMKFMSTAVKHGDALVTAQPQNVERMMRFAV